MTSPHGVPHALTEEALDEAYAKLAPALPQHEKYLLVTLGGDAPPDGVFTPQEAYDLGQRMGAFAAQHDYVLLGTNGPRTGGIGTHEPGMPLDAVSRSFRDGVSESGLPPERQQFHSFVKGKESAYKGLLGAVREHVGSMAVLPGESSSMLTEAIDMLPLGSVAAYRTQAMSGIHDKQLQTIAEKGYAIVEGFSGAKTPSKPQTAAETVADRLTNRQRSQSPVR